MKLRSTIALIVASVLISTCTQAQSGLSDLAETRHIIKTNLVSYAILSVNANYEHKVGGKTSIGLLAGYKLPTTIKVEALGDLDGERQKYTGEIEPQGSYLNPYFRFYTGQAFEGFYIEAFTRYYDYSFLVPYDYEKEGSIIEASLDGTAEGIGGGLSLGGQFKLGPKMYLDVFFGLGVGSGNIHLETNDPNLDGEDYQDIKRSIEENRDDANVEIFLLGSIIDNIEADANEISAWADVENHLFPMTRGGIAIGIGF